jgi:predicted RND superfamily exporter protein
VTTASSDLKHQVQPFDPASGNALERALFSLRLPIVLLCLLISVGFAWQLPKLRLNAGFERMIPQAHPFIKNFKEHQVDLSGQGNVLRIVVENTRGSILDAQYLEQLRKISDEVYLIGGVDRPAMVSLWTPTMRWVGITEVGIDEGQVIDSRYDGSADALERLRLNIERSGEVGRIVAADFKSSMLLVPLLDFDTESGKPLDYAELSRKIEQVRAKYQTDTLRIHIVGFAKVVGDLIDGVGQVLAFFGIAIAIAAAIVFWYTRCVRSTAIVMSCSLIAVVWLLGALPLLGYDLDPYTVLVPFLVFAIGMSHGAQKMNGVMQDIGRGAHKLVAARLTFRRLFMAGFVALVCDAVGFAVLLLIDIAVIQQLALTASIGVAFLVFTNLILLPIGLSYTGVSAKAAVRSLRDEGTDGVESAAAGGWARLTRFTSRPVAAVTIVAAAALGACGWWVGTGLQIGDLDPGAPELRVDSRYNRDNAYVTGHFGNASDVFIVMVTSPEGQCLDYGLLRKIDTLEWRLRQLPGVAATDSFAAATKGLTSLFTEGNPKWTALLPSQGVINNLAKYVPKTLVNQPCSMSMLRVFLTDHRASTLDAVVREVQSFDALHGTPDGRFQLAAGSAGIDAATNIVVREANREMLLWVYGAVTLLCLVAFRSWRATLCAVLPLALTSVLAEALMVTMGIGVKVATLPVIALGVGIGVDYALYVMSIVLLHLRAGRTLAAAYGQALRFTGRVVLLTGLTLAVGVATWAASPIKFQADMGVLLAFCFLFNMIGALILLPALASFLLRPGAAAGAEVLRPQAA